MGYIIGDQRFNGRYEKILLIYGEYKHPTPQDFKRVMERKLGLELDWYFEQFISTINVVDYSIKSVNKMGDQTKITLARVKEIPMPIDVFIRFKDGTSKWYNIPLRIMRGEKGKDLYSSEKTILPDWPWVYPEYTFSLDVKLNKIEEIVIDPSGRLADVNQDDNVYPSKRKRKVQFKGN